LAAGKVSERALTINGTAGDDVVQVVGDNGTVQIFGLSAVVTIFGFEQGQDRVVINARAGDDVIEASNLAAASILLIGNGDDGDDVLIGGMAPTP
jgi:hypothetical protein